MDHCPRCRTACEPEDRFCSQCGHRISQAEDRAPVGTQKSLDISEVQYNLGMVYFKKQDYQRAVETWEKVLVRRPGDEELKALILEARSHCDGIGEES